MKGHCIDNLKEWSPTLKVCQSAKALLSQLGDSKTKVKAQCSIDIITAIITCGTSDQTPHVHDHCQGSAQTEGDKYQISGLNKYILHATTNCIEIPLDFCSLSTVKPTY